MNKQDQKAFEEALIHASLNTNAVMNPGDFNKGFSKGWDAAWLAAKAHYSTNTVTTSSKPYDAVIQLKYRSGYYSITEEMYHKDLNDFPHLDIMAEYTKMARWLDDNSKRRKTKSGMPRFISNWLANAKPALNRISQEPEKKSISEMLRGQSIDSDQCINSYDGGLLIEHDNTGQR